MRNLITFISLVLLISCISCSSRSGKLVEERELAAVEAKIDADIEQTTKLEIERGYDAIIIENSIASYKAVNDSVVVRVEDNVFFHKRRKPVGMINTSEWRYYRVF
jgi:hypothetical protein